MLRATIFLAPFAASLVTSYLVARRWPRPEALGGAMVWLASIVAVGTAAMLVVDRLARRLLPLAALLRMTLIFPDRAPNRFGLALRTGTTRQMERRLELARSKGFGDTETEAAETLLQLVAALRDHDRFTRGHGERVRAYSALIGEELGLDPDEISKLQWAGLIHDVGKLVVPEHVLNKPGRLTAEEYELVKTHAAEGMAMVGPLTGWLGEWVRAVGEHHERWDGGGYPSNLAGEDISLAGRIVAVADTFDVITATRSYKPAQSPQWARRELERNAGTQFDPQVVRAFLTVSIGRLRRVMWPLAWVAHIPFFGSTVTAPAVGAVAATTAVVGTSVVGGAWGATGLDVGGVVEAAPVAFVAEPPSDDPPTTTSVIPNPVEPTLVSDAVPAWPARTPDAGAVRSGGGAAAAADGPSNPVDPEETGPTSTPAPTSTVVVTMPPTTASAVSATDGPDPVEATVVDPPATVVVLPPVPTTPPGPTSTQPSPATSPPTSQATSSTTMPDVATPPPATTPVTSTTVATTGPPSPTTTAAPATTVAPATVPAGDPAGDDCTRARSGAVDLAGADLAGCDLSGLRLWRVDLSGARLNGADLTRTKLAAFDLDGASLRDARLVETVLVGGSMRDVSGQGIDGRGVRVEFVDGSRSSFHDANFAGGQFRAVAFPGVVARGADFTSARLDAVTLASADLHDAEFAGATLRLVDLRAAIVRGADLRQADLRHLNLTNADARGADLSGADLSEGRIGGADVRDAAFVGTRLHGVVGVPSRWSGAEFRDTVCPDGSVRSSSCWP